MTNESRLSVRSGLYLCLGTIISSGACFLSWRALLATPSEQRASAQTRAFLEKCIRDKHDQGHQDSGEVSSCHSQLSSILGEAHAESFRLLESRSSLLGHPVFVIVELQTDERRLLRVKLTMAYGGCDQLHQVE